MVIRGIFMQMFPLRPIDVIWNGIPNRLTLNSKNDTILEINSNQHNE